MSNLRTIGWIVIGGDDQPLRWYPNEGRFYRGIFNRDYRPSVSVWLSTKYDYEDVRRVIASHYAKLNAMRFPHTGGTAVMFNDLRIVRLVDAGGVQ